METCATILISIISPVCVVSLILCLPQTPQYVLPSVAWQEVFEHIQDLAQVTPAWVWLVG